MATKHDGICEHTFPNAFSLMQGGLEVVRCSRPATHYGIVQFGDGVEYACSLHADYPGHWQKIGEATP